MFHRFIEPPQVHQDISEKPVDIRRHRIPLGGSGIFETDEMLAAYANAIEKPMPPPPSDPPWWLKRLLELDAVRMKTIQFAPIDLTRLAIPMLAITGEYDRPAWRTQRMWRELRDFRNVILAGKNHLTAIGIGSPMPPQYIDALGSFIDGHDR